MPYVMGTSTRISPTANVALPHQSMRAGRRSPRSCSFQYAQTVPKTPNGTETRNTSRHDAGASSPPSPSPTHEPPPHALADAHGDQPESGRRPAHPGHGEQDGADREHGQAEVEHAHPAVDVADPSERHHQHRGG